MYFGVYFGAQRGFVFCRGRTNSQGLPFLRVSKCERSWEKWGPVSWCSQILGATSIENTTGSDPCGQPHCILVCLLWPQEGGERCKAHLVVFPSEDHETGPHPEPHEDHETGPQFPGTSRTC